MCDRYRAGRSMFSGRVHYLRFVLSASWLMANYLPVLLVSVSTNSTTKVPDDIALRTQPTAQVDYLSHNWEEEDVWRSWRNMTRQKKAIANGARLENASWRTWWKQRNKLGTVSPETLNWYRIMDLFARNETQMSATGSKIQMSLGFMGHCIQLVTGSQQQQEMNR